MSRDTSIFKTPDACSQRPVHSDSKQISGPQGTKAKAEGGNASGW